MGVGEHVSYRYNNYSLSNCEEASWSKIMVPVSREMVGLLVPKGLSQGPCSKLQLQSIEIQGRLPKLSLHV